LDKATELGIDADAVTEAGLPAWRTLTALQLAADSAEGPKRDRFLARAQDALRALDAKRHGKLLQQFQARLLALQGRGGDDEIAHVTDGELVIPESLQTPAVVSALREAAANAQVPLDRLRVGSTANAVNPATNAPQFADPLANPMEEITVTADRSGFAPQPGDEEMLARLIFSEGADHYAKHPEAFPAIGWSVINRIRAPRFVEANDLQTVIQAKGQFNAVGQKLPGGRASRWDLSAHPEALVGSDKSAYATARETARQLLNGELNDETGGAQYFHSAPETPPSFQNMLGRNAIEPIGPEIGKFKFFRNTRK